MQDTALFMFKIAVSLEIALFGTRMVLQKSQLVEIVGQFVLELLYMCFIATVIMKYEEWSKIIAITGLQPLAASMSGQKVFDVGTPSALIFKVLDSMAPIIEQASVWDFGMVMLYVVCLGFILAAFALITLKYILTICEFHIVAPVGLVLVGLGGTKIFKDYAINVMKYVLSVGIKLFALTLILNIGFSILTLQDDATIMGATKTLKGLNITNLVELILQGIVLLGLAQSLPTQVANLVYDGRIEGGNPLGAMAGAVGGYALGKATGGVGAAMTGAKNVGLAVGTSLAEGGGKRNFWGHAARAAEIYKQARLEGGPPTTTKQLESMLNAAKSKPPKPEA
jgi:type IV secretion system protein TrbL